MMKLFGGFDEVCYDAYVQSMADEIAADGQAADGKAAAKRLIDESIENRIAVYQLYHVLNHVNIFGGGYVQQAMQLAQRIRL
jgi:fructosamine-3-kinase